MSKKILRGGIFKHGFLEPFGIKFEGLDSLFHRSELFIQIHLGVVWQETILYNYVTILCFLYQLISLIYVKFLSNQEGKYYFQNWVLKNHIFHYGMVSIVPNLKYLHIPP